MLKLQSVQGVSGPELDSRERGWEPDLSLALEGGKGEGGFSQQICCFCGSITRRKDSNAVVSPFSSCSHTSRLLALLLSACWPHCLPLSTRFHQGADSVVSGSRGCTLTALQLERKNFPHQLEDPWGQTLVAQSGSRVHSWFCGAVSVTRGRGDSSCLSW